MNAYKKTIMTLAIGLSIASQAHGDVKQLDATGKNLLLGETEIFNDFVKTTGKTYNLKFDFDRWSYTFENIKKYIESNSTVLGIQDGDLKRNLNLLVSMNTKLMTTIRAVLSYERPARKLNEVDYHLLSEALLKPFEQIEQNTKNAIIPALEKQSFYVSAESKNKAKAMLIGMFDLMRLTAANMLKYTAAIIYMD